MNELRLIDDALVNTLIKKRHRDLHKGDCGRVLVIAGKIGMAGAAILSARGALRSGAGLVHISAPEELFPILQVGTPEATCISRTLPPDQLGTYQAIVIGPGLGDEDSNGLLIQMVLESSCKAVIMDADALNLLARREDLKLLDIRAKERLVITPHPGEAARLLGCTNAEIKQDRLLSAQRLVEKFGAVTVLKGAGTLVASPDDDTYINTTGNPGMATGGSGDVLSGIIGALAGQGLSCHQAAIAGVYIHGLAGDLACETVGEHGLIASDLATMTALAIHKTIRNQI